MILGLISVVCWTSAGCDRHYQYSEILGPYGVSKGLGHRKFLGYLKRKKAAISPWKSKGLGHGRFIDEKKKWKNLGGKDHDGMMRVIPCDHVPKQNLISLWVRSLEQEYLSMHSIKIQKIYSCLLFVGTEEKELLNYTMNWVGLFVCLLSPKEDIKVLHSPHPSRMVSQDKRKNIICTQSTQRLTGF